MVYTSLHLKMVFVKKLSKLCGVIFTGILSTLCPNKKWPLEHRQ